MKIEELRIGNWIKSNHLLVNKNIKLKLQDFSLMYTDKEFGSTLEGIPTTEEWLNKLGFEKKEKTNLYLISIHEFNLKKLCVYLDEKNYTIAMVDYFSNIERSELFPLNYNYIHQLQNLFFALTQTELITK